MQAISESTRRCIFFGGMALVILSSVIWVSFPMYRVGHQWERHPIWSPPQIYFGDSYSRLTPDDIERLEKIPDQRAILDDIRQMPRSISAPPAWIGSRYGADRNVLLALPVLTLAIWLIALRATKIIG